MTSVSIRRTGLILLVFVVLGFLIYSNTLDVPFHFDDSHVITDLSLEDMFERCKGGGSRVVSHFSFLINYWLGGTRVLGYHIFNTLIHIGTACFVYIFLSLILSVSNPDPALKEQLITKARNDASSQGEKPQSTKKADFKKSPNQGRGPVLPPLSDPIFWPALLGGILFLVHPLATQAVTYITQRYASLAGFFYIGSLAFFVSARIRFVVSQPRRAGRLPGKEDGHSDIAPLDPALPGVASGKRAGKQNERFLSGSHLLPYLCSFVMAVLAMRTKEMAITLPAVVLLIEYYFIQSDFKAARKRLLYLLPLLSTGLIIPVSDMIGVENISLESVAALQDYTWDSGAGITRLEYLFTQFKIILSIYLKLMVWPIGQNIDHDYVVTKTLLDLPTMASFLALCLILGIGLWLFKRARFISFGILWFFVTILPTSSIVPNREFVAEHRAYISLIGLVFVIAGLPGWQIRWKHYLSLLLPILLLLSGLTYARNGTWQTHLRLWEDSVEKSEEKARPNYNLGVWLAKQGSQDQAISHFRKAIRIKPDYAEAHYNLGNALIKRGSLKEAINHYSEALRIVPDFAEAHYNLGLALFKHGILKKAIEHYYEALQLKPGFADAHYNLGIALAKQGRLNEAISHFQVASRIKPNFADAYNNMGVVLTSQGKLKEAISHFQAALKTKPDFMEAHNNLGVVLMRQGRFKKALAHYSEALRINPSFSDARRNLELALQLMNKSTMLTD